MTFSREHIAYAIARLDAKKSTKQYMQQYMDTHPPNMSMYTSLYTAVYDQYTREILASRQHQFNARVKQEPYINEPPTT